MSPLKCVCVCVCAYPIYQPSLSQLHARACVPSLKHACAGTRGGEGAGVRKEGNRGQWGGGCEGRAAALHKPLKQPGSIRCLPASPVTSRLSQHPTVPHPGCLTHLSFTPCAHWRENMQAFPNLTTPDFYLTLNEKEERYAVPS